MDLYTYPAIKPSTTQLMIGGIGNKEILPEFDVIQ